MDFDNKVAGGITHLDIFPNLFHKVDFSFLARCSCHWLPVLATLTCESADNGGDKDLGISDDRIADNVAFPTRSSHGVWQPSFSNYFEKSASLSKPKTWSAAISTLTNEVWRACKTLLLGKRIKTRVLVAASGRSCLTISFNICTITYAVASYLHYMICFQICQHSYAKFVIWLQMPLIVLEFFTLLLVLHIQYVILGLGLCRFKHNLFIFPRNCLITTNFVRCLVTRIGCRPWSRNLLCFKKWTDGHSIFCRWLSSITMLTVPSCSPRWIQSSTGARLRFLWTLRAHLFFWTTTRRVLALTAI